MLLLPPQGCPNAFSMTDTPTGRNFSFSWNSVHIPVVQVALLDSSLTSSLVPPRDGLGPWILGSPEYLFIVPAPSMAPCTLRAPEEWLSTQAHQPSVSERFIHSLQEGPAGQRDLLRPVVEVTGHFSTSFTLKTSFFFFSCEIVTHPPPSFGKSSTKLDKEKYPFVLHPLTQILSIIPWGQRWRWRGGKIPLGMRGRGEYIVEGHSVLLFFLFFPFRWSWLTERPLPGRRVGHFLGAQRGYDLTAINV